MTAWTSPVQLPTQITDLSYLGAAILFIFALKAMASPRTARRGNLMGAVGMLLAIVFTLLAMGTVPITWILVGLIVGALVGGFLRLKAKLPPRPRLGRMSSRPAGWGGARARSTVG